MKLSLLLFPSPSVGGSHTSKIHQKRTVEEEVALHSLSLSVRGKNNFKCFDLESVSVSPTPKVCLTKNPKTLKTGYFFLMALRSSIR